MARVSGGCGVSQGESVAALPHCHLSDEGMTRLHICYAGVEEGGSDGGQQAAVALFWTAEYGAKMECT